MLIRNQVKTSYISIMTLLLGIPVLLSDSPDWTPVRKGMASIWLLSIDAVIIFVTMI